jgi:hypothetical protein
MINFFVSITTIRRYKQALDLLIESLPNEWKGKYILVYQDEQEEDFKIFEDGHIEVYMKNNIYDLANFIGANILFELNVIPKDSWILCLHDTCKFLGNNCVDLTYKIIEEYSATDIDILWLCKGGDSNICLVRRNAIKFGHSVYKKEIFMSKSVAIEAEWIFNHYLSPKSFNVKQHFINTPTIYLGQRYVYNNENERGCILFESINMEKYYIWMAAESRDLHPCKP